MTSLTNLRHANHTTHTIAYPITDYPITCLLITDYLITDYLTLHFPHFHVLSSPEPCPSYSVLTLCAIILLLVNVLVICTEAT
jgi:hypothetical protein